MNCQVFSFSSLFCVEDIESHLNFKTMNFIFFVINEVYYILCFCLSMTVLKKNSPKLSSILRETFWLNSCGPPVRLAKISCPRRLLFLRRTMQYDNVLIQTNFSIFTIS